MAAFFCAHPTTFPLCQYIYSDLHDTPSKTEDSSKLDDKQKRAVSYETALFILWGVDLAGASVFTAGSCVDASNCALQ